MVGVAAAFLLPVACREKGTSPDAAELPPAKGETPESDKAFIGLTEAEGAALAKERKLSSRVLSIDGQPRPATMDYRIDRVNFEIEKGRIAKVSRG